VESRRMAVLEAKAWLRGRSPDFLLVMEFIGLEPVAERIAGMEPSAIAINLAEFEKSEAAKEKEKRKK